MFWLSSAWEEEDAVTHVFPWVSHVDATSGDTTSEPEIRKKAAEKAQIQKPPTHFEDDSCVVFVKTSFARAFIPPPSTTTL